MNTMENRGLLHYKGYTARPEYSDEDSIFCGKILGIKDMVYFQSDSAKDIEREFHEAVDDYLELCAENAKAPQREHRCVKMITVQELEVNVEGYVEMAQLQDILIVENRKTVAKLTAAGQ